MTVKELVDLCNDGPESPQCLECGEAYYFTTELITEREVWEAVLETRITEMPTDVSPGKQVGTIAWLLKPKSSDA